MDFPEAPCSVNGYFLIDGYSDRFQATGRGMTAQEAASNLKAVMDETRNVLATRQPTVLTFQDRVGRLLGKWLTKAATCDDPKLIERLCKAAALVLAGQVLEDGNDVYSVRSMASSETWYIVMAHAEPWTCECQDYISQARKENPSYRCKHLLATAMHRKINKEYARETV